MNQSQSSAAALTVQPSPSGERARLAGWFYNPPSMLSPSGGPPAPQLLGLHDLSTHISVLDDMTLDFGFNADLAGRLNPYDAAGSTAFDGLFLSASAVNAPYASLASGGTYVGATVALSNNLHLRVGEASLQPGYNSYYLAGPASALARLAGSSPAYDARQANAFLAGMSWDFAPWGGIGLTASHATEQNGFLGATSNLVNSANTNAVGISARVGLGRGWITTASYSEGLTKLDLKPGVLLGTNDDLHTRSYGIAVAKHGLFGNDAFGVAVTRPAAGFSSGDFAIVAGSDERPQFFRRDHLLDSAVPETDFELGYITTFLDGAVALQTNASYQMNYQGQNRSNAVSLLSRAKFKF